MLWWWTQSTLCVMVLAAVVAAACTLGRLRPAVCHVLWLVVLLKFLTPPVVHWPWSVANLASSTSANLKPAPLADAVRAMRNESFSLDQEVELPGADSARFEVADSSASLDQRHSAAMSVEPERPTDTATAIRSDRIDEVDGRSEIGFVAWFSNMTDVLLLVWCVGLVITAARTLAGIIRWRRHMARAAPACEPLRAEVERVAELLQVRVPKTLVIAGLPSPMIWCSPWPTLLWPRALTGCESRDDWRSVIAHELAHVKRHDHWVAWLDLLARCLWWWNPLYWLVRRRLHESAELACDAWVVSLWPGSRPVYARALVEISQLVFRPATSLATLGARGTARRALERRLTMIFSDPTACRLSRRNVLAAVMLASLALPGWSADPQSAEQIPAQPEKRPVEPALAPPAEVPNRVVVGSDLLLSEAVVAQQTAALSPDGKLLALVGDGTSLDNVVLTEAESGRLVRLVRQTSDPRSLAFFPDGKRLAVGSGDGSIRILLLESGVEQSRLDRHGWVVRNLAISGDGRTLVSSADQQLIIWDLPSNKRLAEVRELGVVSAVAISPDAESIAAGALLAQIANVDQEPKARLRILRRTGQVRAVVDDIRAGVLTLAFSPDGKSLVFGCGDETLHLVDAATAKSVAVLKLDGMPVSVAFSPDSRHIAVGTEKGVLQVFRFADGVLAEIGGVDSKQRVTIAAFAPGGDILYVLPEGQTSAVKRLSMRQVRARIADATSEAAKQELLNRIERLEADLAAARATRADPLIKERPATVPGNAPPGLVPGVSETPAATGTNKATEGLFDTAWPAAGVGAHLDLVRLALASTDALGDLRLAEQRLKYAAALHSQSRAISSTELATAEVSVESARRKVDLLRQIATVAIEAAKSDLERTESLYKKGYTTDSQRQAAQARLRILEIILKSSG